MSDISRLKHVRQPLPHGGQVVVLNTGAVIKADMEAMLQALHSRSTGGIDAHLVKVAKQGAEGFMKNTYIGYGHQSVGDLGTVTIFVEGISMLAAKAIQDHQLYNGQESSTRYIDFANQRFENPFETAAAKDILESWRAFYLDGVAQMQAVLAERYPYEPSPNHTETEHRKAINSRAFDIMRAFLPAGATTNLAWHTTIRNANDHLAWLRHHPLREVRRIAKAVEDALTEWLPSSFPAKRYEASEGCRAWWMTEKYYLDLPGLDFYPDEYLWADSCTIDIDLLYDEYGELLRRRPEKTTLPKQIEECGMMQFRFLIDFGSFRDIQRNRGVHQRMPLLTDDLCFESWYLDQLPDELRSKAQYLIEEMKERTNTLDALWPTTKQYLLPMGYRVSCRLTGGLSGLVYFCEQRSSATVHPTARRIALGIGDDIEDRIDLNLYLDRSPDRFVIERGKHDIVENVPT